jgi:hypothetical protein
MVGNANVLYCFNSLLSAMPRENIIMTKIHGSILVISNIPEDEKMYPHLFDVLTNLRTHFDDVIYVGTDPRYHPLFEIDKVCSLLNTKTDFSERNDIQAYIGELVCQYKQIRDSLIDSLQRIQFKHAGRLVIAIDDHAFNCAIEVFPKETIYWSFDVLGADCPSRLPNTSCISLLLNENGEKAVTARGLIVQDPERKNLLEDTLEARFKSVIYLPVALNDNNYCKNASVARLQQGVPGRLKVVQSGHICESRFSLELVKAFQNWPQYCELHVRGYLAKNVLEEIQQATRPVSVSGKFIDNSVLSEVINTFDIGFIGYKEVDRNHLHIVNASSQLVAYLRLGMPVICCGSEQLLTFVSDHGIGISAKRPEDISLMQIQFLLDNYKELSRNARFVFEKYFNLGNIMELNVFPELEKLMRESCVCFMGIPENISQNDKYYNELFVKDPEWSSPNPNEDEKKRWEKISTYLNVIVPKIGFGNNRKPNILEIGSGRGWLTNLLTSYGKVIGLEPVKPVVDQAAKLFPDIKFVHGTTDILLHVHPQPIYDIIVSSEVIEHVPYNEHPRFVENISRLIVPEGYVIITTPRKEIYELLKMRGVCSNQPVEDWLTEQEMADLFMKNGMSPLGLSNIFIDAETLKHIFPGSPSPQNVLALYQIWLLQKTAA